MLLLCIVALAAVSFCDVALKLSSYATNVCRLFILLVFDWPHFSTRFLHPIISAVLLILHTSMWVIFLYMLCLTDLVSNKILAMSVSWYTDGVVNASHSPFEIYFCTSSDVHTFCFNNIFKHSPYSTQAAVSWFSLLLASMLDWPVV